MTDDLAPAALDGGQPATLHAVDIWHNEYGHMIVDDAPAGPPATEEPKTKREWPPAGYLCLVKGNDCPGHPSKWMTCGPATEDTP